MTVWTIGHSTRALEELLAALKAHGIESLCDVRSFPRSRRHPHFNRENLQVELPGAGLAYHWFGEKLGGYRKKTRPDSPHTALRSPGFRNYADHMESDAFREGIEELLRLAEGKRSAYMCAERLWWRCHRSLISDYLAAVRGAEIIHIHDEKKTEPHRVSKFARVADRRLVYDVGESGTLL
ncbi:MAG TPA: DUF488 domain-containing protein [Candidatus Xenobia bacterium]|nr:DUF488 domain-containing protein [Candidatus Xenobia bacterium]